MFKKLAATALGGCLLVAALCLGLLPTTALAAGEDAPNTLWVGETPITGIGYWTTDANGKLTASNENNYNVYYDGNGTLTLNNATIQGRGTINEADPIDYGIYAASTSGQSVALTINLIGSNTVKGYCGIYVGASGGDSTLVIQSDSDASKGSLEVSGSGATGIYIVVSRNSSGNPSLTINNASVEASTEKAGYHGVSIVSRTTSSPTLSLAVNGGSLTAQDGIRYVSVAGTNSSTSLTVGDSALIKSIPDISASGASEPTPQGDGIVFDGTEGTVYGDVTLDESLTIAQGETLTIPEGSTLNTNGNLANNGTVTIQNGGTLGGADTINNTGTINVENGGTLSGTPTGGTVVYAPVITANPTSQTVTEGEAAEFSVTATGDNLSYQWQQSTDNGQSWTNIDGATGASYATEVSTASMNGYQYRCVASNSAGSVTSSAATLTVNEHVHEWIVAWSWDGTKATATFACKNDGSHQATEDAAVVSAVKTPATCTEAGVTTYTATVEFDGETYTSTKDVADIPATGHEFEGGLCSVCGARDTSFSPALVSGDGAKWTKGSSKGLTFVSSAAFADLVEVRLDGRVLSASEYAVREGSTVVTLPAKLLEGLKAGDHELLIVSGSGTVRASLTVAEAAKVEGAAKTEKASADELPASGDSTAPALAVAAAAAAGAGLVLLSRRRAAR